jgi:hypothetical protein
MLCEMNDGGAWSAAEEHNFFKNGYFLATRGMISFIEEES